MPVVAGWRKLSRAPLAGWRDVVTNDIFMTMKAKPSRHSFMITKRGRRVARVVPLMREARSSLRGSLLHEEDLLAPLDATWEATVDGSFAAPG